jgi:hypothetical protein
MTTVPGTRDVKFLSPKDQTVHCSGSCNKVTNGSRKVGWLFSKRLRPLSTASARRKARHKRAYPPVRVALDFFCVDGSANVHKAGRKIMTIRFDRYGQVDKKKSDLAGTVAPQP